MKKSQRSLGPARLAACAALIAGLAGGVTGGGQAAQADVRFPVINQKAIASWGANENGQLGNGTTSEFSTLFGQVSGLASGIVQVAAASGHALALRSDGTVWAWGTNTSGELGDGTFERRSAPVKVLGLTGVIAVSAGIGHCLALRSDGTVWAWGNNQYGQVGNGVISVAQLTPVQVTGLAGVTKIAAGGLFSLALRKDGTVWAWGYNNDGELGNGTTLGSSVPVQVTGLSQVTSIAAGGDGDSSLAIRTGSVGVTSLWAWGANTYGELGDGTRFTFRSTPEQVTGFSVAGIAGLAVGDSFSLLLGTDGSVWAWGADGYGQLGNAPNPQGATRRTIAPGSAITQLASGLNHALAVRSDGTVLAWGNNSDGALGDGDTAPTGRPVQVSGLTNASQVAAGWGFILAVYLPPPVGTQ